MNKGRITHKAITKPSLMNAVILMDGVTNLARALKVSHSCVSNWLYTEIRIKPELALRIEKVCRNRKRLGLSNKTITAEEILSDNIPLKDRKCQK